MKKGSGKREWKKGVEEGWEKKGCEKKGGGKEREEGKKGRRENVSRTLVFYLVSACVSRFLFSFHAQCTVDDRQSFT